MAITGNKGEWSEMYAFLKLLGEKKLYSGDENLNRIEDLFYPIIKILRDEREAKYSYALTDDIVVVSENGVEILRKSIQDFLDKAQELLAIIKTHDKTFSAPEIETFMREIHCSTLKAKSTDKTDIRIVIHDLRTGMQPLLGFSIKSQLGSPSTLLNPSANTNFIYKVKGATFSDEQIKIINNITTKGKIQDRVDRIRSLGRSFEFIGISSRTFLNNLVLIDSYLPNILSNIVLEYYSTNNNEIRKLTESIASRNPAKYDISDNHNYYEYKIKNLLTDVALGMVPGVVWTGRYQANGGYLVVKSDGDVVCYHFYDKNLFEDYLYHNTRLDTPSSTRYGFGVIEKAEDGTLIFKLNLQIRFL